jgi:hypothetical protein
VATKTSVQSGNWSDGATWGGSVPADGDTVVVSAGHTVTFDVNLSAWTTGVAGLTVTSAAGTPGRLQCATANGTYVLPIKSGSTIAGTNAANKGQFYAGSAGTPLPNGAKFTINFLGGTGSKINRQYLDVQLYCTQPTYRWVKLSQDENAGATVLHVDTDVTGDIWAPGDIVALCNINKGVDYQRTTIAAGGIAAGTITVNDPLDSQNLAGSYLVRVTRNIEIATSVAVTALIDGVSAGTTVPGVINCAIRQTGTQQGVAIRYAYGDTIDAVVNGFSTALSGRENCTVSGCLVGNTNGIGGTSANNIGFTISGLVAGSATGIAWVMGGTLSGVVAGCGSAGYYCVAMLVSGQIVGCATGLNMCTASEITGSVTRCTTGLQFGSGTIKQGAIIGGSGADANATDLAMYNGRWRGYGGGLRSSTQVGNYLAPNPYPIASVVLYDAADASGNPQLGRMAWWNCGGYGKSEDWVQGTHGNPPVPLAYVHKHTFEAAGYANFVEVPIWGEKDVPLTVSVYIRKQQNGMTATPTAKLIDPNRPLGHANEALDTATMTDNTDWQTLTLEYTPTYDRQIILRVSGTNASGTMWWDFNVAAGGGGGYTYGDEDPAHVLTTATGAGDYDATNLIPPNVRENVEFGVMETGTYTGGKVIV